MLTTKDLPESERPYEKCEQNGPKSLSNAELLAVIIKTGTKEKRSVDLAHELLNMAEKKGGLNALNDFSATQLMKIPGIGRVKAIQIQCVLEFSKRMNRAKAVSGLCCTDPASIAGYYMEDMRHFRQEHLIMLMLNTKNRKIGDITLSKGSVNAALISTREIFAEALRHDAVNIILLHNHPSGDPTPSAEDIAVTRTVASCGELLGVHLLDHIIIGDKTFQSLYAKGLIQNADT